ncbi:unnamed protein product [Protopolystoma xenopodis]|uniref:Uncharacterized protein n=1 Tax=Protopolystoma xenopodis TaxID=117903 RepID=A0A3S5A0A6_9PLAT|nr:unnamed protein product [Protopolystoma xenopodis]
MSCMHHSQPGQTYLIAQLRVANIPPTSLQSILPIQSCPSSFFPTSSPTSCARLLHQIMHDILAKVLRVCRFPCPLTLRSRRDITLFARDRHDTVRQVCGKEVGGGVKRGKDRRTGERSKSGQLHSCPHVTLIWTTSEPKMVTKLSHPKLSPSCSQAPSSSGVAEGGKML